MRIMHVIHGFPPYNNAGAEIYHYRLAREQARDNDVAVFYRGSDETAAEYAVVDEQRDGLTTRRINNTQRNCKSYEEIYANPPIAAAFGKFLDEFRPDIVHIGHMVSLSTGIVDEAKRRGIPTVMTLHDFWLLCPRGQLIDKRSNVCAAPASAPCEMCQQLEIRISPTSHAIYGLYRKITRFFHLGDDFLLGPLRKLYMLLGRGGGKSGDVTGPIQKRREDMRALFDKIDLFISPSEFLRGVFVENGMPAEKIIHSDNGQDTSPFRDFRRAPSDKIRFGFVGAIIPTKGLHVLLEAFHGLDADRAEVNVFGEFSKSHEHEQYVAEITELAATPGVNMRGRYLPEQVADAYGQIDVLVLPSVWYENQPLVIMEAFMSGTPIVVSNFGGMAELVRDGENGFSFAPGDAESLRGAMQKFVDDPELLQRLAAGVPRVKSIEDNAREIMDIYRNKIGNLSR